MRCPTLFLLASELTSIAHSKLEDLGAKARVMELMGHSDPDVKYQSLVAVQRLVSHAWA